MNALETRKLDKSFGNLVVAEDISLSLPAGARHALIGPNGAGKTTLINLITGALKPDAGEIFLGGHEISGLSGNARAKRGLGRTFQINTLFASLTPLESVALAVCERHGVTGKWLASLARRRDAIDEAFDLLSRLGLAEDCTKPTRDLPYGQQRLLEIALALAGRPSVLLLDEPAAGVPTSESTALFDAIAALPEAISVLFIEHDMNIVFTFASRITVLVQGRVLTEGPPDEIARSPEVRAVYLGGAKHG